MLKLKLNAEAFNALVKRLQSMASGDKTAKAFFDVSDDEKVSLYFQGKLDKSEVLTLLYEQITPLEVSGRGRVCFLISNFFGLRLPVPTSDTKLYPSCKDILLVFTDNILEVQYTVAWSKNTKPSKSVLRFPLIQEDLDSDSYEKLFEEHGKNIFQLKTEEFLQGASICSFIRGDATSKDSNGSLFIGKDNNYLLVSTDSNIAVQFRGMLEQSDSSLKFKTILSNSALSCLKHFIGEEKQASLSVNRSALYAEVPGRRILIPAMQSSFPINKPEDLFTIVHNKLANLDLRPIVAALDILVSKLNDLYKVTNLSLQSGTLNITTNIDKVEEVPSTLFGDADIKVNGDLLLACTRRLLDNLFADLFYGDKERRVYLATEDQKIIFLIQGL